jgi:thiamine-phosphate pyrophosphorylase
MKLLVISNPEALPEEAAIINQLFASGLEILHLRKPGTVAASLEKLLNQIQPEYYSGVALHQHHKLAEQFGIKRLHFPEKYREQTTTNHSRKLKKEGFILTTSVHAWETLKSLDHIWEYVFFSPVFTSISKPGYHSGVPSGFYLPESYKHLPVIALGGINSRNIHQIKKMNFDGSALLGAIWQQTEKTVEEFIQIKELCSNAPMY